MARITHYASLLIDNEEVFGTAEFLNGSGYLFRKDGERKATLVSRKDINLMLYGLVDLVAQADAADGDRVRNCSQTLQEAA